MIGSEPRVSGVSVLPEGVRRIEQTDLDVAESIHGWIHVWQFPRGWFWPLCSCGWLADDGFPTEQAALESVCGRDKRNRR